MIIITSSTIGCEESDFVLDDGDVDFVELIIYERAQLVGQSDEGCENHFRNTFPSTM